MNLRRNNTRSRQPFRKRAFSFNDFDDLMLKRKQKNQHKTKHQRTKKILTSHKVKIRHCRHSKESFQKCNNLPLLKPLRKHFSEHKRCESTRTISDETVSESPNAKGMNKRKLSDEDSCGGEKSSFVINSSFDSIKPKHFTGCKSHTIFSKLAEVKYFDMGNATCDINIYNCSVDLGVKVPLFPDSSPQDKGALTKLPHSSLNSPGVPKCFDIRLKSILSKSSENLRRAKKVLQWADGKKHTKDASVQAVPVCNVYVQTDPVEVISVPKLPLPKTCIRQSKRAADKQVLGRRCRQHQSS